VDFLPGGFSLLCAQRRYIRICFGLPVHRSLVRPSVVPLRDMVTGTCKLWCLRFSTTGGRSHTHTLQSSPTLRTAGTLQGVPPSCCGRRVAVWSVCSNLVKGGKRHDGQAACEPGGGGCGGVPVHPLRLHTHRTSLSLPLCRCRIRSPCRTSCSRSSTSDLYMPPT
jgi:hypothetical protein